MKRQLAIVLFAAMMMLAGAYSAQTADAHERRSMKGDGEMLEMMLKDEHPMWRHLRDLGLDEQQKAEVKEIRSRVMKETIKMRADERIAGIELKDLLDNDTVDMKAVQAKLRQAETIRTAIRLSRIRAGEEVKSILTPGQRKKLKQMCEMGPMVAGGMKKGMRHAVQGMPPGEEEEEM